MKRVLTVLIVLMAMVLTSGRALATTLGEAEIRLICALSSMASYNDDNGILVRDMLKSHGWDIESIGSETKKANAKALIVSKRLSDGGLMKVLAICGTNDVKDAEIDFRLKQVPVNFNGKQGDEVLVHQGFKDYSEVILSGGLDGKLISELSANPSERLYLTGHSLGGAVAIVTAAKLIDLNISSDRVAVVTFGSPAVGNQGFNKEYGERIQLTRVTVSGDPIKKSLQVLGYAQFGDVIKYKPKDTGEHFPHKMAVYLDCAIKDYYDERGVKDESYKAAARGEIYIAPMQVMKNSFSEEEFKYVKAAMRDQQQTKLTSAVYDEDTYREVEEVNNLAVFDNSIAEMLVKARAAKCKYVLVQYLQAKKIREDRFGAYRVSLEEITYDLKGSPVSMQTASVTTRELTLLEAAIFAQENIMRGEES